MGAAFRKLFGKKDMRILMLGLDAAGKTSILLKFKSQIRQLVLYSILYVHNQRTSDLTM